MQLVENIEKSSSCHIFCHISSCFSMSVDVNFKNVSSERIFPTECKSLELLGDNISALYIRVLIDSKHSIVNTEIMWLELPKIQFKFDNLDPITFPFSRYKNRYPQWTKFDHYKIQLQRERTHPRTLFAGNLPPIDELHFGESQNRIHTPSQQTNNWVQGPRAR